jgi:hypothetical protein
VIFSLAEARVPALSGAKGGGSLTLDKGKSTPRKPTVIDRASLSKKYSPPSQNSTNPNLVVNDTIPDSIIFSPQLNRGRWCENIHESLEQNGGFYFFQITKTRFRSV